MTFYWSQTEAAARRNSSLTLFTRCASIFLRQGCIVSSTTNPYRTLPYPDVRCRMGGCRERKSLCCPAPISTGCFRRWSTRTSACTASSCCSSTTFSAPSSSTTNRCDRKEHRNKNSLVVSFCSIAQQKLLCSAVVPTPWSGLQGPDHNVLLYALVSAAVNYVYVFCDSLLLLVALVVSRCDPAPFRFFSARDRSRFQP